jgi:hypothetical protein
MLTHFDAASPGRKSDLIATLFGMDQFNDFAAHYNESMDPALTLGTTLQAQLAARRQVMRADEEVRDGEAEALRVLDQAATDYAGAIAEGLTYDALRGLVGSPDAPGRLQELDAKLHQLMPAITGCSRERLEEQFNLAVANTERVAASQNGLEQRRNQVSFRNLFAAVQSLRAERDDQCPACLTPIDLVASNPFERAEAGLTELEELAQLEEHALQARHALDEAGRQLLVELRNLEAFLLSENEADTPVYVYLHGLAPNPDVPDWWAPVLTEDAGHADATPSLDQLLQIATRASGRDDATREALQARDGDLADQARLNDARVWMAEHDTRRTRVVEDAAQATTRLIQWEVANADLIRQAGEEALL